MSHCEGEAKTHIRPTDPALTRAHRSELAGLQPFGGREVAAGAGREAAKGTASRSETQCCALLPGRTPPAPSRRAAPWVCLPHQCQMGLWPPNNPPSSLFFYLQVLTHQSHPGPCAHLFSLGTSAWRPQQSGGKGLESRCWCAGTASHQDLSLPGKAEQGPHPLRGPGASELEDKGAP